MEAAIEFIRDNGGWGAWFLTVAWVVWSVMTDRLITPGRHKERVSDLHDRLRNEIVDKEFWREAATLSTELGNLLGRAKIGGRRRDDGGE